MIHVLTQTLCSRLLQIFYSNAAKYELNLANRREYVILTRIFKTPSPRFSVVDWTKGRENILRTSDVGRTD